jgi:hypothetical protein
MKTRMKTVLGLATSVGFLGMQSQALATNTVLQCSYVAGCSRCTADKCTIHEEPTYWYNYGSTTNGQRGDLIFRKNEIGITSSLGVGFVFNHAGMMLSNWSERNTTEDKSSLMSINTSSVSFSELVALWAAIAIGGSHVAYDVVGGLAAQVGLTHPLWGGLPGTVTAALDVDPAYGAPSVQYKDWNGYPIPTPTHEWRANWALQPPIGSYGGTTNRSQAQSLATWYEGHHFLYGFHSYYFSDQTYPEGREGCSGAIAQATRQGSTKGKNETAHTVISTGLASVSMLNLRANMYNNVVRPAVSKALGSKIFLNSADLTAIAYGVIDMAINCFLFDQTASAGCTLHDPGWVFTARRALGLPNQSTIYQHTDQHLAYFAQGDAPSPDDLALSAGRNTNATCAAHPGSVGCNTDASMVAGGSGSTLSGTMLWAAECADSDPQTECWPQDWTSMNLPTSDAYMPAAKYTHGAAGPWTGAPLVTPQWTGGTIQINYGSGTCSAVVACCGDGVCQSGETGLNCGIDCGLALK